MDNEVAATPLAGSMPISADLSIWGLFLQADIIVKIVMVLLFLASIWSWAIIIEKTLKLRRVAAAADKFENDFWSGGSLDQLADRVGARADHPMAVLFVSAMREWRRSSERGLARAEGMMGGVQQRVAQVMRVTIDREMERLERYVGFLATVGSTAPFVGLLGTVVGIINSFQGISADGGGGLSSVAGGISEALVATAVGLLVAIPAVVMYNSFNARVEGFQIDMNDVASELIDFVLKEGRY